MLTHIVVWKYKEETTEEVRQEHRENLRKLPDEIPHILKFEVGADMLHLERSYDTGLVAVFPSREELDFYTDHETHQAVAKMGKEIAAHVASVDFET